MYFPKLENEEEAAYLAALLGATERAIARRFPAYPLGSLRTILVFENPRAIFRIKEMAEALHPYFLGGSLGWHDFLASTARIFKADPLYSIPVKADPNIVIRNIKESHRILVRDLKARGPALPSHHARQSLRPHYDTPVPRIRPHAHAAVCTVLKIGAHHTHDHTRRTNDHAYRTNDHADRTNDIGRSAVVYGSGGCMESCTRRATQIHSR